MFCETNSEVSSFMRALELGGSTNHPPAGCARGVKEVWSGLTGLKCVYSSFSCPRLEGPLSSTAVVVGILGFERAQVPMKSQRRYGVESFIEG